MEGKIALFIGLAVLIFIFASVVIIALGSAPTDASCGGIAGKSCPAGFHCQLAGDDPDAGGVCVSYIQPLKDKIYEFIPSLKPTGFTCPVGEWVDCMPGPGPAKPQCQKDYLDWATKNCPNFRGAAY